MSEIETYQHEFKDILFPIYHNDHHKNAEDTDQYVAYTIKDERFRNFLHYWYMFQTAEDFDFEWYKQCRTYIDSLHPSDKYRLRCYSRFSDEIINTYMRDPTSFLESFPIQQKLQSMEREHLYFFMPDLLEEVGGRNVLDARGIILKESREIAQSLTHTHISNNHPRLLPFILKYIEHMRRILRDAPRPSHDILVFRGVGSDYLKSEKPGKFHGFTSTTWYPQIAYSFGEDANLLYEFWVNRHIPALCIHSISEHDEYEVLLDTDIYGVADRPYEKYQLDLYKGDGQFPAAHIWDPKYTEIEGTPRRITMKSRIVLVSPEGVEGGFVKNRTMKSIRTTRTNRRSVKRVYSRRKRSKIMFDSRDPASPTFIPTSAPIGQKLLQSLRAIQLANPRRKIRSQSTRLTGR